MQNRKDKSLNERFTDIADRVSRIMGMWYVTVISIILVVIWLLAGPIFKYSDTWQLIVNTPTTILEMWIGFLLGAASNRSERELKAIIEYIKTTLIAVKKINEQQDRILELQNKMLKRIIALENKTLKEIKK